MKLDAYAAIWVGVDFFAFGADDKGGLQAVDLGFDAVEAAPRVPGDFLAQAGEQGQVFGSAALLGFVVVAGGVFGVNDQEFMVALILPEFGEIEVAAQGEAASGLNVVVVAAGFEVFGGGFDFFHAQADEVLAVTLVLVAVGAGVFVDFKAGHLALLVVGRDFRGARVGAFEVKAGGGVLGGGYGADGCLIFSRYYSGMSALSFSC